MLEIPHVMPPDDSGTRQSGYLFVSYSTTDSVRVRSIVEQLRTIGYRVWIDEVAIEGGENYGPAIVGAIRKSAAVALFCTSSCYQSRNVRQEIAIAWKQERPILPLRLESVEPPEDFQYWLEAAQWLDLLDPDPAIWLPRVSRALDRLGVVRDIAPVESQSQTDQFPSGQRQSIPAAANILIGREADVDRIALLLSESRLVTLTGPGGVGKTRLAVEAANRYSRENACSAAFVSLAAIRDDKFVVSTIARALELPNAGSIGNAEALATQLGEDPRLLVLDNLEQIVTCGKDIATLLSLCPNLKCLATSRVLLNIQAERVYHVEPLRLPPIENERDIGVLLESPAVRLFVDRVRASDPDFDPGSAKNCSAIGEICRRLDGLPLAIELAAARARLFPPETLLDKLERRLPLLTGGPQDAPVRQRTLRDAIAWSHDLLPDAAQVLFRRLAVFVGGFTLEAVEAFGQLDSEPFDELDAQLPAVDILALLVDSSLVHRTNSEGLPRFSILETIREFGIEQLAANRELEVIARAHAVYVMQMVEQLRPRIEGPEGPDVISRFEVEHPNIRAALTYSIDAEDGELGNRLTASLWKFWVVHSHIQAAHHWIEQILALPGSVTPSHRMESLYAVSSFSLELGQGELATLRATEGLALARAEGDEQFESRMLFVLGLISHGSGDLERADNYFQHALVLAKKVSPQISFAEHMSALILVNIATIAYEKGRFDEALDAGYEARSIWLRRGDSWGLAVSTEFLGVIECKRGAFEHAGVLLRQSQSHYRDLGDRSGMTNCLAAIALVAAGVGQLTTATRLLSASIRSRETIRIPVPLPIRQDQERTLVLARSELGKRRFEAAWQTGWELTLEDAFIEASVLRIDVRQSKASATKLSPRELEVLRLMAEGCTDQEIADNLYISYRTTTTHVTHILDKLGVDSRTAAVADAIRLELI